MRDSWSDIVFIIPHVCTYSTVPILWFFNLNPIKHITDSVSSPESSPACTLNLSVLLVGMDCPVFGTGTSVLFFGGFEHLVWVVEWQSGDMVIPVAAGLPLFLGLATHQLRCTFRTLVFKCPHSPLILLLLRYSAILNFIFVVLILSNFISVDIYVLGTVLSNKIL